MSFNPRGDRRMRWMSFAKRAGFAGVGVFSVLSLAPPAWAVNSCNGLLTIDYVSGPNFTVPGDVVRVRLSLGTGSIQGGTKLTVNRVRFDLDCNDNFSLGIPCTDEGAVVEYEGDGTITTTCPGAVWTTGHPVAAAPNEIVFTPAVPVNIPPGQSIPPGFCVLEFDVKVLGPSTDTTPTQIQEATGFTGTDAVCDNGLQSTGSQSSSIPLCPTCTPTQCSTAACNQDIGQCVNTPVQAGTPCDLDNNKCTTDQCDSSANCAFVGNVACAPAVPPCEGGELCDPPTGNCIPQADAPDSTPCGDTDANACTTAGCDGLGICSQTHVVTVCPPDTNECTDDPPCNPQTGMCEHPPKPDSTPCTDTDGDICTTAGCAVGTCNQSHIICVTTTTSTSSTTTTSTSTSSSTSSSVTTTSSVTSTTGTTICVPTPENTSPTCSDMIDNDCDGLVDCADPDCAGIFPCPRASKDPTIILFGRGGHLDRIHGHAKLQMTAVDLTTMPVSVLLSDRSGVIYSDALPAGALTATNGGTIFRFINRAARDSGGMYDTKIKKNKDGSTYTFSFTSYGDLSRATDAHMRLQFYIGNDGNVARDGRLFITIDTPWTQTPRGWRAPKDH